VSTHKNKLQGVVNQIETSLGVSYDASLEPINLRTDPYESLSVLQLVHTENKVRLICPRGSSANLFCW